MGFTENLIQAIIVLIALISLGMLLRRSGMLREEHSSVLANLVTNVTLPALIFTSLAKHPIGKEQVLLALVMIVAEIVCIFLAMIAGNLLKLSRIQKGAFILVSGFGSSAFLGYALVKQVFTASPDALADAVVISELGVGILIFTVGVMIAMYFGSGAIDPREQAAETFKFFRSPIFIALVLGILYPFLPVPQDNIIMSTIFRILNVLKNANTVLVALTIGVLLQFKRFRYVIPVLAAACVIKLIIQPVLVSFQANWFGFHLLYKKVLILEAAMPSATLAAVFASRYGCDSELASIMVFVTTILSVFTVVGVFVLFG